LPPKGKQMNKLWKFKRYLTLDDVADYLSSTFNDEVQRIDVERLVLDKHMTGSVIVNDWHCFILKSTDADTTGTDVQSADLKESKLQALRNPDEIISGVYRIDLAEFECNRDYITIELKSGCKAACYEIDDSKYNRAIKKSDSAENGSSNHNSMFDRLILGLDTLPKIMDIPANGHAYIKPTIDIEKLVIQQSDLEAFITKANNDKPEKLLDHRERASMERIILALAKEANYKLITPYSDAETLEMSAATNGIMLPATDTIAKFLKAAAERYISDKQS
jgi:hypothetical protein